MNLKKTVLLTLLLLFALIYFSPQSNEDDIAGVNEVKEEEFEDGTTEGNLSLSRDLGYYMNTLLDTHTWLLKNNEMEFDQQVDRLKRFFIVQKGEDLFIRWTIKEETSANGLADDVRIIKALYKAADQFDRPDYKELADKLASTISKTQQIQGVYTDYTDWAFNEPAKRVTLSELVPDLFTLLNQTGQTEEVLKNAKEYGVFFPEFYDLESQQYKWGYDIYMEEQLRIAINRQRIGQSSLAFQTWILSEWDKRGKIPVRYIRTTRFPAVEEESLEVYLYLAEYFRLIKKDQYAKVVETYVYKLIDEKRLKLVHFFEWQLYEVMKESHKEDISTT